MTIWANRTIAQKPSTNERRGKQDEKMVAMMPQRPNLALTFAGNNRKPISSETSSGGNFFTTRLGNLFITFLTKEQYVRLK